MNRRHLLLAAAGTLAAPAVHAQTAWPRGRPIRVIVPWPPGAANDTLGRLLATRLSEKLGATAVAENRTGGAGLPGTMAVIQAPPDGYTLLASAFNTAVMPLVLRGATFDPQRDLEVCARTARAPLVLAMAGNRPPNTLQELITAARARPRDYNFAISSLGSAGHLATIEFLRRTGLDLALVTYRGTQPALTDMMAGSVQLLIDPSFAILPARGDGRIKVLGIATSERSGLANDVPTMTEGGLPGYEFQSWYGVWAPRGTPDAICDAVNALMQETMKEPAMIQRLTQQVLEPVTETRDETRRFIASEIVRAGELLRSVNYQPE